MKTTALTATALLCALLLPACAAEGLAFRIDERLEVVSPSDRAAVKLPVTVDWEVTDFTVTKEDGGTDPSEGYFAVFIDRAPQPPGETVAWFAKDDEDCRPEDKCPDRRYLADRGIHTTRDTKFVVENLAPPPEELADRREFHEVTIVLLDGSGHRIGESAFTSEFEVQR